MRGLDYSSGKPGGRAVRDARYDFVVRYLQYPGARPKFITRAEAQDLLAHGIAIALVWETTAGRALDGRLAGAADARIAASSAAAVGQPGDRPVYFAVDVDVTTPAQMAAVDAYLDGAASVIGRGRVGVYGEHEVVEHCLSTGRATWGWQTMAWSRGKRSDHAHLIQELGQQTVGGVSCDVNTARQPDFGQWPAPGEDDMPTIDEINAAAKAGKLDALAERVMVMTRDKAGLARSEQVGVLVAQLAAARGEVAGLSRAMTMLTAPAGVNVEALTKAVAAAAEGGARDALHQALAAGAEATA